MANKPVDPRERLDEVDEFLRRNEAAIKNLAQREIAADKSKATESLPTESLASPNKEKGKATKTAEAIDKLKDEKNSIREAHQAILQQKQGPRGPHG